MYGNKGILRLSFKYLYLDKEMKKESREYFVSRKRSLFGGQKP